MIQYKTTNRLFNGQYQYKVVLIVPGASLFRNGDMAVTLRLLKEVNLQSNSTTLFYKSKINTQEDLDYGFALQALLSKMDDYRLRVENPWISIYTNSKKDVNRLVKLNPDRIKYVSNPPESGNLISGTVILPKINFEYKVTLGKTTHENSAFIEWAQGNNKVKLTKSCIKELTREYSWGGAYFYISGEKNLLVAKMHLGGSINKIERVVKS